MAVAIAALVVAASGTAVAATTLTSGDSLIAKHSLSGNRLRNHTITGKQIKLGSLGTVPSATNATNATNAANATKAMSAGSAPIAQVTYAASSAPVNTSAGPATGVTVTATCPAGTVVTGGGASDSDTASSLAVASYPTGKTGWAATFFSDPTTTATVTAICAPAAATAP